MITFLSVLNVMMLLPLTLELRDHYIPDFKVDANSYTNLRVVASSFFPASELLYIPLIPNLRVVTFLFHLTLELMSVHTPASQLLSIYLIPNLRVVVFLLQTTQELYVSPSQPLSCSPFSNFRVVAPFPASKLLSLFLFANLRVVVCRFTSNLRVDVHHIFSTSALTFVILTPTLELSPLFQPQSCMSVPYPNLRVVATFPASELYVSYLPQPQSCFPFSSLIVVVIFHYPGSELLFTILFPTSESSICLFPTSKLTFTIFFSQPQS